MTRYRSRLLLIILLMVTVLIAGCRSDEAVVATAEVRSTPVATRTPLPPLPAVPAVGSAENPILLLFVTSNPDAEEIAADLSVGLSADADIAIEVQTTESYAQARMALCTGTAMVVSLDAFSYLAISGEDACGELAYVQEIDDRTFSQGQFIGLDLFAPRFYGGEFCRPGPDSISGWIIPRVYLLSRGVDPLTSFPRITDTGSDEEVVRNVTSFGCGMGAIEVGAEIGLDELPNYDRMEVLRMLPPVPYDVVVISTTVDAAYQALFTDVLTSYESDIAELLEADSLETVAEVEFAELRELFTNARVDISALTQ